MFRTLRGRLLALFFLVALIPSLGLTYAVTQSLARSLAALRNPETERMYRRSQVAYYEKHLPFWAPLLRAYLKVRGKA